MHVISIKMKNGDNVLGELIDVLDTHYIVNIPIRLHVVLGGEEMMFQTYHQPSLYYPYGTTTYVEIPKEDTMIVDSANEYYSLLYDTTVKNLVDLESQRFGVLKKLLNKNQKLPKKFDTAEDDILESSNEEESVKPIRETEQFKNDMKKIAESSDDLYGHVVDETGEISFIVPGTPTKQ